MDIHNFSDELVSLILMVSLLLAAKPILSKLLLMFYNLFIGTDHI